MFWRESGCATPFKIFEKKPYILVSRRIITNISPRFLSNLEISYLTHFQRKFYHFSYFCQSFLHKSSISILKRCWFGPIRYTPHFFFFFLLLSPRFFLSPNILSLSLFMCVCMCVSHSHTHKNTHACLYTHLTSIRDVRRRSSSLIFGGKNFTWSNLNIMVPLCYFFHYTLFHFCFCLVRFSFLFYTFKDCFYFLIE